MPSYSELIDCGQLIEYSQTNNCELWYYNNSYYEVSFDPMPCIVLTHENAYLE